MTDYKPGDPVEFTDFPTAGRDHSAGTTRKGTIVHGPYRERVTMPQVVLINTDPGVCVTRAVSKIRPAPPEPEWEYLLLEYQEAGKYVWAWEGYPGYDILNYHIEDYDHVTRRQVGKPETVECLTQSQVEELRSDRSEVA